jgi:uncharacterized protein (TIGR00255 family)
VLLSMTGFGSADLRRGDLAVSVEVRAVNNRHLKVTVRGSDPYPLMESEVEKVVRRHVKRGTVLLHVRVDRPARLTGLQLDANVLKAYLGQLAAAVRDAGDPALLASLASGILTLPGVVPESGHAAARPSDEEWPAVEAAIDAALQKLDSARRAEGAAMAGELLGHHAALKTRLAAIQSHLPKVMHDYRARLLGRVRQAVADAGVTLEPDHLIREVALFADRTDVAEEVHRLTAHLALFDEIVRTESDSAGRRLEFVAQEIGREVNTLGSKAGDPTLSNAVFEMKVTLEKVRELVQNAE